MLPIKTILMPTDFSPCSEAALAVATGLAADYSARLVLLHVKPPEITYGEFSTMVNPDDERDERQQVLERCRPIAAPYPVELCLADGDAATEILHIAQERRADLIVMGTHGRRGIGRLLVGSVAEKVVHHATVPVLMVKEGAFKPAATST